jgi:hypothetical protein
MMIREDRNSRGRVASAHRFTLVPTHAGEEVASQCKITWQTVIDVTIRVGRKTNGREEVLKFLHFIRCELFVVALQIFKGLIEFLQSVAVAAPMMRLLLNDVLQRLGHHRSLHGVPVRTGIRAQEVREGTD